MECPECQRQNPDDSKYCNECGCSLIDIKYGKDAIPAIESERKHVSILFSDLSGYTAMTEKLDPEKVKEIMNSIFGEITRAIHRYDGFIESFIGDGVMAIFGVPYAHEDDPIRAIRSAMAVHAAVENISPQFEKKIGRPLTMHTGINTGLVVTGNVDIEKGTHGLIGDAINMASRLEDLAKPGEILIGEDTYRQAKGVFIFKELEPVTVKGKAGQIRHFHVIREMPETERLSGLALHGISAPLIGRKTEYDILSRAVTELNEGHGGIVTLIGEAGIGKSRLVADIRKGFMESQDRLLICWLEGRALSYGQTISYWPFQEILWEFAGITETDNEDNAWIKLENSLSKLFSEDIGDILPYLASLMSLNVKGEYTEGINYLDGEALGRLVFLSVRRFFERLAKNQPIILVFEDLHWLDKSSGALLEHLLPLVRTVPLLICITGRPQPNTSATKLPDLVKNEYKELHKDIQLLPLSTAHSTELIDNLLEIKHIPIHIQEMIVQKAEGNPFFLEEIIRSFIDTGVVDLDKAG